MSRASPSRRQLVLAAGALSLLPTAATAGVLAGWREAVVITPDPGPWIETLTQVGGWEVAYRGAPDSTLNALWSLPPTARTEQVLMRNVGVQTGFIRLVRARGVDQDWMRPDDQPWEPGGVQALDVRVVDIESTRSALHARGWRAPSDPVRYKAYGVEVIQWAPSSPDGVRLSFIQRIAPPLQGWSELKRWSRAANAAVTVTDMAAAEAFFGDVLGLTRAAATNTVGGDGPNVMGLPWDYARRTPVRIQGWTGGPGGEGAIELISMPSVLGRNHTSRCRPPNFGIAALRIVVGDAPGFARRLTLAGVAVEPMRIVSIPPWGPARAFAVNGPDGVRLEFVELAEHGGGRAA